MIPLNHQPSHRQVIRQLRKSCLKNAVPYWWHAIHVTHVSLPSPKSFYKSLIPVCCYMTYTCLSLHHLHLSVVTSLTPVCRYITYTCLSLHHLHLSVVTSLTPVCLYMTYTCRSLHHLHLSVVTSLTPVCRYITYTCLCYSGTHLRSDLIRLWQRSLYSHKMALRLRQRLQRQLR